MPRLLMLIVVVVWGLCVVAGYALGRRKGRLVTGLWLTAIFSLPGLVILACWPRAARPAEPVNDPVTDPPPVSSAEASGGIPGNWEPSQAHSDSWIWR